MNEAKHTKGPWHWGNGFAELQSDPRDPKREYTGPKYADIGLWGPNGEDILPLRIDHYEIEWDSRNELDDLKPADRALIAAAPDLLEACEATRRELAKLPLHHLTGLSVIDSQMERAIAKAEGK